MYKFVYRSIIILYVLWVFIMLVLSPIADVIQYFLRILLNLNNLIYIAKIRLNKDALHSYDNHTYYKDMQVIISDKLSIFNGALPGEPWIGLYICDELGKVIIVNSEFLKIPEVLHAPMYEFFYTLNKECSNRKPSFEDVLNSDIKAIKHINHIDYIDMLKYFEHHCCSIKNTYLYKFRIFRLIVYITYSK